MYLSYLLIETGNDPDRPRPGRLWLGNRYRVHQRLCMAFPSASRKVEDVHFLKPFVPNEFACGQVRVTRSMETGFLFRIDPLARGRAMIVVQSAIEPDWEYGFHNAKHLLAASPAVKPFEPRFSHGQTLRFRLEANPTRRLSKHSPDAKQESVKKRVPVPTEKLVDWLLRRAVPGGFSLDKKATTIQPGYAYMSKNGKGQQLRSVRFDGSLCVTDPDSFRHSLVQGIGSGKAFGFGLLSVSPV